MSQEFIIDLQELMQRHGERLPKYGADGVWGMESEEALERLLSGPKRESGPVIPDDYWPMLSKIESGDRPYVQAPTSSASGLYQFIKSTWIGEGGKWGPTLRPAFGGLKPSPEEQLMRAKSFTQKNANALAKAGIPINKASLYAAHFLGAGTAIKALGGGVNDRIDAHVEEAAVRANPSILGGGKTVANFLTWLHKKTGDWAK